MRNAVEVEGISKRYRVRGGNRREFRTIRDMITRAANYRIGRQAVADDEIFWALRDVSFSIGQGEVVGIIGRNGAGKSTLLKILSRITEPTAGVARIRGRVGSLLEVGTGFHPELTGRENIYLNGAILGMRRAEIRAKFDEIVEFSGVSRFLDTPVKRFSSGMTVRLAFAVAAHLEPEILIVDEVLAVGDAAFQAKCLGKMSEVSHSGRTVLFVSHNLPAVGELCSRAIRILDGRVVGDGTPDEMIRAYLVENSQQAKTSLADRRDRQGHGRVRLTGARITSGGTDGNCVKHDERATVQLRYLASGDEPGQIGALRVIVVVSTLGGAKVLGLDSQAHQFVPDHIGDEGVVQCEIPRVPLVAGTYRATVSLRTDGTLADKVENAFEFEVMGGKAVQGIHIAVEQDWSATRSAAGVVEGFSMSPR
jgi:lipopolysaccharide transport system ATP-binding protein